jgi:lysophospholipase-3
VSVADQTVDASCPRSGTFQDWFPIDRPSTTFNQVCQDELLTLRYDARSHQPMRSRFHEQRGVKVSIIDFGKTSSAPFYEPMYEALEAAGYERDRDIRVAGYDARLTPDMGGFLERTKKLIERTYRDNGNRPVHLTGHSNGPIYAEYLLTHTSAAWKHKYIHGFSPIAGNLPGQGGIWFLLFAGLNIADFTLPTTVENARSSARLYLSAPSTYLSAADPRVFGAVETVLADASTGRSYTPVDYRSILADAGVAWASPVADRYVGFLHMADPSSYPNVDVYAEKGSGIETLVGIGLPDLTRGQLLGADAQFFTRDGDINQEDITNDAIGAWAAMPCFHFSLTDNPGVDHFSLPGDAAVLARLIANANAPRSGC